jgi:hypothetical protein
VFIQSQINKETSNEIRTMKPPTRREFLEAAAASATLAGIGPIAHAGELQAKPRPRIAAISTAYHYLSHAYHIVGRFLDGFDLHDGQGLHKPDFEVASLFIEQTPANDLGRDKARRHGVRLSASVADALMLGTGKVAVDGVLLIAEHGDYPFNPKLQKLYPRGRLFREVLDVLKTFGVSVPIFIDKHLSHDTEEAFRMVDAAKAAKVPLMAGSSLPVTWRLPELEVPLGLTWKEAVVASRGEVEIFGFHALESLQCMVERRDRKGHSQGVKAVACYQGSAVWEAREKGLWSNDLLQAALSRSHTLNPGDIRQNTKDFTPPSGRPSFLAEPIAFVVDYVDGFRGTALILNGHVDDTTMGLRIDRDREPIASTLFYLPAPPGARFFDALVLRIEDFLRTGRSPYPLERTLLTGGMLDALLSSRLIDGRWIETPNLAAIDYVPPVDSGFIRTPLGG